MDMKLLWLTDIHLDFLDREALAGFLGDVRRRDFDALAITGDIANARTALGYLRGMAEVFERPLYYVLGNHDFYGGSIADVRAEAEALSRAGDQQLVWLPAAGVVPLTEHTALVGHDGWADAGYGDWDASTILFNDYFHIRELADAVAGLQANPLGPAQKMHRREAMRRLADEAAAHLRHTLPYALRGFEHVVVLTHVPPFAEACVYMGHRSGPLWLPHLASAATGTALLEAADAHPDRRITVLCGHTHGRVGLDVRPNLRVEVGGATYRYPAVQEILELT